MDLQQRLTDFVIVQSTWIVGLLVGLSIGGVAMALERAIDLISRTERVRKMKARISRFVRARLVVRANRIVSSRMTWRPRP